MKGWLFIFFLVIAAKTIAQDKALAYIDTYKDIAISEMQRTGVPAAITLAQGMVESGCGEGDLCKSSNNHFGIKCKNDWVGDKVYHDDDFRSECFRSYSTGLESYRDHSDFLRNRPPYVDLFKLDPTDYEAWAKGLKKAGYATEKDYPQKLIKVINDYNLNQYSLMALHHLIPSANSTSLIYNTKTSNVISRDSSRVGGGNLQIVATKDSNSYTSKDTSFIHAEIQDTILGELVIPLKKNKVTKQIAFAPVEKNEDSVTIINSNFKDSVTQVNLHDNYPKGVFVINHAKVIYVAEGISLLSIANQFNIALVRLLEYNELIDEDVTTSAQLIYLEQKQVKGASDNHIVAKNETLSGISQSEGVRLDKLLVYNKLKKDSALKEGDKILLHSVITKKPV